MEHKKHKKNPTCGWCNKEMEIVPGAKGRPRKYCSASCRQRAYEQRNHLQGRPIPADAVILPPDRVNKLIDGLFELRCAAEDIATAVSESSEKDEVLELCEELVTLAKRLERMRVL